MPTGKVKWYEVERGFGFITSDEGDDVFLHATALPEGQTSLKGGTKVEFSVADGKRGKQALHVKVLEAPPSVAKAKRKPAEDMVPIVENLIKMLDGMGEDLKRNKYPTDARAAQIAKLLRGFAAELEV